MKVNQMFSHFQRDSSFIGVVKRPLHSPDTTASATPIMTTGSSYKNSLTRYHAMSNMSRTNVYTTCSTAKSSV